MSHKKLAEIVVRSIEYFELVDDKQLDPDTAVQYLEGITADLNEATPEEQGIGPGEFLGPETMQFSVRGTRTMIDAAVQRDVDGIP